MPLQPCRNIDPVAEYVLGFDDHVAQIDPDAKSNPPLLGHIGLAVGHAALNLHRAPHGIDDARELGQQAVAGVLHNPAAVLLDLRIDRLTEMRF